MRAMLYLVLILLVCTAFFSGCDSKFRIDGSGVSVVSSGDSTPKPPVVTTPSTTTSTDATVVSQPGGARIAGYWENTTEKHDERKPWTDQWVSIIKTDLYTYSKASDVTRICPKYTKLTDDQKIKAILEFHIAVAYYESGFNPKSSAVDVGNAKDRNSYSDGLYQLSGNDGSSKFYGYTYKDLLDPLKNIKVAGEQYRRQLKNENKLILHNSSKYRYWAVALDGNKYSHVPEILARVIKYAPACK